jgi:rod shape-determining protein MreC
MNRKTPKRYFIIFAAMLLLMSIPAATSEKIRGTTVVMLAPLWNFLAQTQRTVYGFFSSNNTEAVNSEQTQKLQLENHLLISEIERLHQLFQNERYLGTQLSSLPAKMRRTEEVSNLVQRHYEDAKECLTVQLKSCPAQVIFRSPSSWSGTLWLNVGKANNSLLKANVVAKNSPVLVGTSIVGVIDYVGEHQSRVRLITDSALTPSVRAVRGSLQQSLLAENVSFLVDRITLQPGLFSSEEEKIEFLENLCKIQCSLILGQGKQSWYLAKGELHGSSHPLWRSSGNLLRGIGFNYDFADDEGPARDLRSGQALQDTEKNKEALPILKVNDLLVTTGMDGIFPAGLHVAEVTKVQLLKEGDYYYELEARPTAGNLNELSIVFVIPPLGYDPEDQPPMIGR